MISYRQLLIARRRLALRVGGYTALVNQLSAGMLHEARGRSLPAIRAEWLRLFDALDQIDAVLIDLCVAKGAPPPKRCLESRAKYKAAIDALSPGERRFLKHTAFNRSSVPRERRMQSISFKQLIWRRRKEMFRARDTDPLDAPKVRAHVAAARKANHQLVALIRATAIDSYNPLYTEYEKQIMAMEGVPR